MPIYEYECVKCGNRQEQVVAHDFRGRVYCRKCGGYMKKIPSAPSLKFNGSGWTKKEM